MSLDFDLRKVRNSKELWVEDATDSDGTQRYRLDAKWEGIVFAAISVGIGHIADADEAAEFYARLRVVEKVYGAIVGTSDGQYFYTPSDVQRMIGLRTNVFPRKSRAEFCDHLVTSALNHHVHEYTAKTKEGAA